MTVVLIAAVLAGTATPAPAAGGEGDNGGADEAESELVLADFHGRAPSGVELWENFP